MAIICAAQYFLRACETDRKNSSRRRLVGDGSMAWWGSGRVAIEERQIFFNAFGIEDQSIEEFVWAEVQLTEG